MFVLDVPPEVPQFEQQVVSVTAASTTSAAQPILIAASTRKPVDMVIRDCILPGHSSATTPLRIDPFNGLEIYFQSLNQQIDLPSYRLKLIEQSKRAPTEIRANSNGVPFALYFGETNLKGIRPENRPKGVDQATFLVEIRNLTTNKDMTIRLILRYGVESGKVLGHLDPDPCPNPHRVGAWEYDPVMVGPSTRPLPRMNGSPGLAAKPEVEWTCSPCSSGRGYRCRGRSQGYGRTIARVSSTGPERRRRRRDQCLSWICRTYRCSLRR